MSELPKGWALTSLGNVGRWCSGGTPSRQVKEYFGKGIPWVKSGDLPDGPIQRTDEQITELGLNNSSAKLMPSGTISIALYGATIGKLGVLTFPAATNQACANVIANTQLIDPQYLFFYLMSERKNLVEMGQGGAQPNISQEILKNHPIPLAPLHEQRRIVAKLEKLLCRVDAAQARLAKIPLILNRFRQSVLAAACSGRLTTDWREQNSNIESGSLLIERIRNAITDRYKRECTLTKTTGGRKPKQPAVLLNNYPDSSELPHLPPNWNWSYLQNLGEFTRGRSKHRPRNDPKLFHGPYPFLQTGDISQSDGRITRHSQTYNDIGLAQSRLFPAGTLCITIAANIAETAILSYPACFPDSIVGFIPEPGLFEVLWAMYFIRVMQNDLETFAPATAQKNINMDILSKVAIPVPPLVEQREIVNRVEGLFKSIDSIEARHLVAKGSIDNLTQSILARAFRGQLVPPDPSDEPASVLLQPAFREDDKKSRATNRSLQKL